MANRSQTFNASLRLNSKEFKKGVAEVQRALAGLKSSFLSIAGALGAGLGFTQLISRVKDTAVQLSVAKATLENVSNEVEEFDTKVGKLSITTNKYGENLAYVHKMANDYSQDLVALMQNFAQFHAASEKTDLSLEQQKYVFEQLTRAAAFYHMSADRTKDMMNAITQMMSKGKVAAEEMRKQLGNALPGAFNIMAMAMGVSNAQLDEMMRKGQVVASEVLPKFAAMLKVITTDINLDSLQMSLNRLKNSWYELVENSGSEDIFNGVVNAANKAVSYVSQNINDIKSMFKGLAISVAAINIFGYFKKSGDEYIKKLDAQLKIVERRLQVFKTSLHAGIKGGKINAGISDEGFAMGPAVGNSKQALSLMVKYNQELIKANQLQHELYGTPLFDKKVITYINEFNASLGVTEALAESANKQIGLIGRALMSIRAVAQKLISSFMAFLPYLALTAAITAVTTILDRAKHIREETERIANIMDENASSIEKAKINAREQVTILNGYMSALTDTTKGEKERLETLNKINEMMGTNFGKDAIDKTTNAYKELTRQTNLWAQALTFAAEQQAWAQQKADAEVRLNRIKLEMAQKEKQYEKKTVVTRNWKGEYVEMNKLPLNGAQTIKKEMGLLQDEAEILTQVIDDAEGKVAELEGKWSELIVQLNNNQHNNNGDTETDITKVFKKFTEEKEELANQLREHAISQEEYNKELDKLVTKYWQSAAATGQLSIDKILDKMDKGKALTKMEKWYKDLKEAAEEAARTIVLDGVAEAIAEEVGKAINDEAEELKKELEEWAEKDTKRVAADTAGMVHERTPLKTRDSLFDYKKSGSDIFDEAADVARDNAKTRREEIDAMKAEYDDAAEATQKVIDDLNEMEKEYDELIKKAEDFEQAARYARLIEDIKKMKKELQDTIIGGVKNLATSLDRCIKGAQELRDVFEDTDSSGWDKFMAVFNELVQVLDTFMSIMETVQKLGQITDQLNNAELAAQREKIVLLETELQLRKQLQDLKEKESSQTNKMITQNLLAMATSKSAASASAGEAVAGATASGSKLPFPYNLAAIAAGVGAVILALSKMNKYAKGGIVGGNSYSGDKQMARVNSGEMVLNKAQQGTLWNILNGKGGLGGNVQFTIRGADLVGTLNNYRRLTNGRG